MVKGDRWPKTRPWGGKERVEKKEQMEYLLPRRKNADKAYYDVFKFESLSFNISLYSCDIGDQVMITDTQRQCCLSKIYPPYLWLYHVYQSL